MEQYELPFNKYENPTVELDFEEDEETYYCDVCGLNKERQPQVLRQSRRYFTAEDGKIVYVYDNPCRQC